MMNDKWTECFELFRILAPDFQHVLRKCAAEHLIERGCEEVGSSDVNNELFHMWTLAGEFWHQAIINEVNRRW